MLTLNLNTQNRSKIDSSARFNSDTALKELSCRDDTTKQIDKIK